MATVFVNKKGQPIEHAVKYDFARAEDQLLLIGSSNWREWVEHFPIEEALQFVLNSLISGSCCACESWLVWDDPDHKEAEIEKIYQAFQEAKARDQADTRAREEEYERGLEQIVLSDRDRDQFLDALKNPPEPNEKLKEAFKKHAKKP